MKYYRSSFLIYRSNLTHSDSRLDSLGHGVYSCTHSQKVYRLNEFSYIEMTSSRRHLLRTWFFCRMAFSAWIRAPSMLPFSIALIRIDLGLFLSRFRSIVPFSIWLFPPFPLRRISSRFYPIALRQTKSKGGFRARQKWSRSWHITFRLNKWSSKRSGASQEKKKRQPPKETPVPEKPSKGYYYPSSRNERLRSFRRGRNLTSRARVKISKECRNPSVVTVLKTAVLLLILFLRTTTNTRDRKFQS